MRSRWWAPLVGLLGGLGFAPAPRAGPAAAARPRCSRIVPRWCWSPAPCTRTGSPTPPTALGAGADRERALEIMRDSRIGSFGALALMMVAARPPDRRWRRCGSRAGRGAVLIAAAMASRAMMPVVMLLQPSARATGLAAEAGRPEPVRVMIGTFIAIGAVVLLLPAANGRARPWSPALSRRCSSPAWLGRRLGGCTGDTLGAVQQMAEIAFLFAIVSHR